MKTFRIGRHLGIGSHLSNLAEYAQECGYDIFQIFLAVPQKILSKPKRQDELKELGKRLKKHNVYMVVHGSYIINLCHSSGSSKYRASLANLIQDVESSSLLGDHCLGVIIHMGKNVPEIAASRDQALQNYIHGLQEALQKTPTNTRIILETGASQGNEIASQLPELAKIYYALDKHEQSRIMFCIDTCHIWATGYDISSENGVNTFFTEFDALIGIKKIACIHFNDSRTPRLSRVDRHADLGYGTIGESGLQSVLKYAKKHQIPVIMETPLDAVNPSTNQEITYLEELELVHRWTKSSK